MKTESTPDFENDYCILHIIETDIYKVHYKQTELHLAEYIELIVELKKIKPKDTPVYLIFSQPKGFSVDSEVWDY